MTYYSIIVKNYIIQEDHTQQSEYISQTLRDNLDGALIRGAEVAPLMQILFGLVNNPSVEEVRINKLEAHRYFIRVFYIDKNWTGITFLMYGNDLDTSMMNTIVSALGFSGLINFFPEEE